VMHSERTVNKWKNGKVQCVECFGDCSTIIIMTRHTSKNSAIRKEKAGCNAPTMTEQTLPSVMYSHSGEFIFRIFPIGAREVSPSVSSS
jgi:hypothetical protein